jgi:hypothetical protein
VRRNIEEINKGREEKLKRNYRKKKNRGTSKKLKRRSPSAHEKIGAKWSGK